MNRITRLIVICHISVLFLPIALFGQTSKVVSVSTNGQSGDGPSFLPHLSRNGRYVVFRSLATNFTSKDTGGVAQIYLHDRKLGTTFLISQNAEGEVANAGNSPPFISATGRYVAWGTTASNLVPGDTNELSDCFIYDRILNTLERRVVQRNGEDIAACFDILETRPVISLSKDGRYAAIQASGGVWVLDRKTTSLTLLSDVDGNGVGGRPVISADGSTVVFNSPNANIGSTGASKGTSNIWTYDIANGTYELISKGFNGDGADKSCERASISDDGRRVLYDSSAQNLVDDGSTNEGVFLYDRDTGITIRVSKDLDGNPVDSTTEFSYISGNGLFAAFSTRGVLSSELNTDDFKIGIYDIEAETTLPIGTAAGETSADRTSLYPVMDGVGYRTVFFSQATNISEDDTHGVGQVFLDTVVHCENSSDLNDNDVLDCLDPSSETRPERPTLANKKRKKALLLMEDYEGSVEYAARSVCRYSSDGIAKKQTKIIESSDSEVQFLGMRGKCRFNYVVRLDDITSKRSKSTRGKFKTKR